MRISYSALDSFQQCPLKYKFREIDKIRVPKSKEAVFGTVIHETLRMLHEPSRLVPPTESELLEYFSQKWDLAEIEDQQEKDIMFSQGIGMLKNYYGKNYPTKFNIVGLETFFEAPILARLPSLRSGVSGQEKDKLHLITGKIDRIDKLSDGNFEIIDYKTAKKMPPQKQVDQNLQLDVYHLGVINRWPSLGQRDRPIKLSLYFLKHGEKLSTFRSAEALEGTKEHILDVIDQVEERMKEDKFEPRQNPLCDWCEYQPICPLFRHKFASNQQSAISNQQIKEIIDEYLELRGQSEQNVKRMAEIKDLINQYLDQQGLERVFSEKGYMTRLPQQRYSYNFTELKKILEPFGKWNEIMAVDANKLKKVIAELPQDIRKKIAQIRKLDKEFKTISASRNKK